MLTLLPERFAKFTTRKGRKVTSFGVLFDFTGNDDNTTVQKVANMVKEKWFADAIKEEPDFFLLAGYVFRVVHFKVRVFGADSEECAQSYARAEG